MKRVRHQKIIDIITNHQVQTQEELISRLRDNGCEVTQATISRDIRELHLSKVSQNGVYHYAMPKKDKNYSPEKYNNMLQEALISVEAAQNMVVFKTYPGMANAAAAALDAAKHNEMVGTLAGDDTIFVVMRTSEDAKEFCDYFAGQISKNY